MFYYFLYPLRDLFSGFNVFRYITFRAALASVTAFLISVLVGPFIIRALNHLKIGQTVRRKDVPDLYPLHKHKEGTPTMGGVLVIFAIVTSCLLWADLTNRYILVCLVSIVWLGMVGFLDDYLKLLKSDSKGLQATMKLAGQVMLGVGVAAFVFFSPPSQTTLEIPFLKNLFIPLGGFYLIFIVLVIVGSSNAVNLTDGLDGLAIGSISMVALTLCIFSYVVGNAVFCEYLWFTHLPGSGELTVFCAALFGGALGFLWFNSHPAEIFMGDTGALALGGSLGVVSVLIRKELILFLAGGIFVVEALSVMMQVASFKFRGKRIFLMAPLHHHFELKGLNETKVVVRFWIVGIILVLICFATLKLR
ncbi:MAG: phospho-N-acetylmuramoyl-pentapeptide-transferase [Candidatus Omnitrophica bacterium]|nr:phospho-N-acetylmuramoyl-pentapeptide-transferase [Candidatus Omnitrophota bacterium]